MDMNKAACQKVKDPEIFWQTSNFLVVEIAKQVCLKCTVAQDCLQMALDNNETDGIWGGLTPSERLRWKRNHKVKA